MCHFIKLWILRTFSANHWNQSESILSLSSIDVESEISIFFLNAEKLRKFELQTIKMSLAMTREIIKNNGLPILFPFFPIYSKILISIYGLLNMEDWLENPMTCLMPHKTLVVKCKFTNV